MSLSSLTTQMAIPRNLEALEAMFCFLYNVGRRVYIHIICHFEDLKFETNSHNKMRQHYFCWNIWENLFQALDH